MVAYLEQEELVVGVKYYCETYDGESRILEYVGDGMFGPDISVVWDVRYVFREAVMSVAELKASCEYAANCIDENGYPEWHDAMPIMLDLLEAAIEWKKSSYSTNINSPLGNVWRALEDWDI